MRIRVEGSSTSKLPALVFIHGAGGAATVWLEPFRHFERARRVVAPDLPGHGQSDVWHEVPDAGRIAHYRDAIGVACAHLGVHKAILVGHSMGGLVGLDATAAYPDKVAGVVLLGAALDMRPDPALLTVLRDRPSHQAEILAELGWSPATPRDNVARWFRSVTCAPPERTLEDLRAVAAWERPAPSKIATRVLCIGGRDDLLCPPALVEQTARQLGRAEVVLLSDCGHHPHLEQPSATVTAIERFAAFV